MLKKSNIINLSNIDYVETITFIKIMTSALKYHLNYLMILNLSAF
jgi:hypothetical protein